MPDPRLVARLYAFSRIGLGAVMALAPTAATRPWIGDAARLPGVRSALRVLGVRDALLGAAVLGTPDGGVLRRRALLLCAAADVADVVVTTGDYARARRAGAGLAALTAAGGAALGTWTATRASGGRDG
ncbi:MAG: hypothetical protein KY443_06055 [Actinobacteria bacterium]|nr:hypothetical protein [Actinomycetota bacterium]